MDRKFKSEPKHSDTISEDWNEVRRYVGHRGMGIGVEDLFFKCQRSGLPESKHILTSSDISIGPGILRVKNKGYGTSS